MTGIIRLGLGHLQAACRSTSDGQTSVVFSKGSMTVCQWPTVLPAVPAHSRRTSARTWHTASRASFSRSCALRTLAAAGWFASQRKGTAVHCHIEHHRPQGPTRRHERPFEIGIQFGYKLFSMKVSVAEAKNKLPKLIKAVQDGESVTIYRHGTPVVDIVPTTKVHPGRPKFGTLKGRVRSPLTRRTR